MTDKIRITGPDDDGFMWVHFDGARYKGALSAGPQSLVGKAMQEVMDSKPPVDADKIPTADKISMTPEQFGAWLKVIAPVPPVPDDVAEAVEWLDKNSRCEGDYMAQYDVRSRIRTLIRAASTSKVKALETLCDKYSDALLYMNLRNDQLIEALEDAHEALAATLAKSDNAVLYQRTSNILAAIRSEETIRAAGTPSAEVMALQKIPLSASTSGDFIAPDYIKGWNAAIDAINQPHPERK